jgi:lipoprotein-anchoring transpeptidase ErfK/SrfK
MHKIDISINEQKMSLHKNGELIRLYSVSTGKNGAGEEYGSEKTPRGQHIIRARIGDGCPENTVFRGRRPTGEIYSPELSAQFENRDWILTRILWLSGKEIGKNRLGPNDTMRRYIYIHGTPDSTELGKPGSRGCIRMKNSDIIELFSLIACGTEVNIA